MTLAGGISGMMGVEAGLKGVEECVGSVVFNKNLLSYESFI